VLGYKAGGALVRDSSVSLSDLDRSTSDGKLRVPLSLAATGKGAPLYYYLTVHEVPASGRSIRRMREFRSSAGMRLWMAASR
jgi:hypothetical protein